MHTLITGGAGFIGSHLAEELLGRGDEVIVLDDLSTGSMANISHLKNQARFHYIIDTVMNRSLLAELVDDCDVVFHLAAAVGVQLIVESPVRTLHTNIRATELVLDAATKKKRKLFSPRLLRFTANATRCRFARMTIWSSGLPCADAGVMPVPKQLMNSWPCPTTANESCRW